jgi:hypothetical protein
MTPGFSGADWQANLALWVQTQLGAAAGVPAGPQIPFYRMGEPYRIPVSPGSAGDRFDVALPPNATSFRIVNANPFAVRLRGTKVGQDFQPVTPDSGWLFLPGTEGIYTTLGPIAVSVMSVDGPYVASDPNQKAGSGILEMQYGTGY